MRHGQHHDKPFRDGFTFHGAESGPSLFANQQSRLHLRSTHLQLLIRYLGPRYQSVQLHRLCALKPIVMDREKLWGMPTCGCQVTPATCTVRPCLFVKCLKRRDAAGTSFACNWYQPVHQWPMAQTTRNAANQLRLTKELEWNCLSDWKGLRSSIIWMARVCRTHTKGFKT